MSEITIRLDYHFWLDDACFDVDPFERDAKETAYER